MRPALVLILLLAVGCADDSGPSDPGNTDEPPTVSITSAPSSALVGELVTISFVVTDDVELFVVSVGWGTLDAPVEIIMPDGSASISGDRSLTYGETGSFTITVNATDTSGKMASDSRQIEILSP